MKSYFVISNAGAANIVAASRDAAIHLYAKKFGHSHIGSLLRFLKESGKSAVVRVDHEEVLHLM